MNIQRKKFGLIYFLFLLVYIPLGQNMFISTSTSQTETIKRNQSVLNYYTRLKSAENQMLAPFSKSYPRLDVSTQNSEKWINNNLINPSTSAKYEFRSDSDTLTQTGSVDIKQKSAVTDSMLDSNKSSQLTFLDSVAESIISLSYLDSMTGGFNYIDSVVHFDISYQEASGAKSNSGPYSQSVSNLKDY